MYISLIIWPSDTKHDLAKRRNTVIVQRVTTFPLCSTRAEICSSPTALSGILAGAGVEQSLCPGISVINDTLTLMNDYPFLAVKYIHCFISLPRGEDPTLTGAGN